MPLFFNYTIFSVFKSNNFLNAAKIKMNTTSYSLVVSITQDNRLLYFV